MLKSFYEATLDISNDDACISLIIPLIAMLNSKHQATNDERNNDTISRLKHKLLKSLNKRFAYVKNSTLLITATLLDPRFKTNYLTSDEIESAKKEIISFLSKQENILTSPITQTQSAVLQDETTHGCVVQTSHDSKESWEQSLWEVHDKTLNEKKDIKPEGKISIYQEALQSYLRKPRLQRNVDIYAYWHSSSYQQLQKAANKFLSAPPTSVASEQLFSSAGQIYADRRSNLLGINAEKLFFLAYNIRLFNYDY